MFPPPGMLVRTLILNPAALRMLVACDKLLLTMLGTVTSGGQIFTCSSIPSCTSGPCPTQQTIYAAESYCTSVKGTFSGTTNSYCSFPPGFGICRKIAYSTLQSID